MIIENMPQPAAHVRFLAAGPTVVFLGLALAMLSAIVSQLWLPSRSDRRVVASEFAGQVATQAAELPEQTVPGGLSGDELSEGGPPPVNAPMSTDEKPSVLSVERSRVEPFPAGERVPAQPESITQLELPSSDHVRETFLRLCAICHGPEGLGDGPAASALVPMPRDFVHSSLRFASTGGTQRQVVGAIERTIAGGIARSAMPGFHGLLSESEIAGLARYVLGLRGPHGDAKERRQSDLGQRPPVTGNVLARGEELYTSLSCTLCHGASGRGDGPSAAGLTDVLGRPVRPADFTSGLFKAGQSPENIARVIIDGVPGTPMPSFEPVLIQVGDQGCVNTTDLWALVAYIRNFTTLIEGPGDASGSSIHASLVPSSEVLSNPADAGWIGIDHRHLRVKPLQQSHHETNDVWVRVARTRDEIAVCLEWSDSTCDLVRGGGVSPDSLAVIFSLAAELPVAPLGLDSLETRVDLRADNPLNGWLWSADRQLEALEPTQPGLSTVIAPPPTGTLFLVDRSARRATAKSGDSASGSRAAQGHAALEANALGVRQFEPQPASDQDLTGTAVWSHGTWRVVLRRSLKNTQRSDVQFDPGTRILVAFAISDGVEGEFARVKRLTGWHWLVIGDN